MDPHVIGSCQFTDKESGEPGFMIVRLEDNSIGVGLSLEEGGDVEVFLDFNNCQKLAEWLNIALANLNRIS